VTQDIIRTQIVYKFVGLFFFLVVTTKQSRNISHEVICGYRPQKFFFHWNGNKVSTHHLLCRLTVGKITNRILVETLNITLIWV